MTKARQRERAKRRKHRHHIIQRMPIENVRAYVNGIEKPLKSWDGKRVQFCEPPPEGAIIIIKVGDILMEGIKCK